MEVVRAGQPSVKVWRSEKGGNRGRISRERSSSIRAEEGVKKRQACVCNLRKNASHLGPFSSSDIGQIKVTFFYHKAVKRNNQKEPPSPMTHMCTTKMSRNLLQYFMCTCTYTTHFSGQCLQIYKGHEALARI